MRNRNDGSITIYFCLLIVIIGGLLLSLLEAVRVEGLHSDAQEWTEFALLSLCGGYDRKLFDAYEIFALDGSFGRDELSLEYGEAEMTALIQENLSYGTGINLYRMQPQTVEIIGYRLLTDDKGQNFLKYIANIMKNKLSEETAKNIAINLSQKVKNADNTVNLDLHISNANQALETARAAEAEKLEEEGVGDSEQKTAKADVPAAAVEQPPAENPIEEIKKLLDQGIWALAVPADVEISNKTIILKDTLENRELETGIMESQTAILPYERVLFQEYVKAAGGNFFSPAKQNALSYGMEYLLFGKESDEKNLKAVVNRLLLIREGINYLYLQSDSVKQAEALTMATSLAGSAPAVIPVVQQGILAAWAYAESICEVRALLSGKKIPLVKKTANWQVSLTNIASDAMADYAKSSEGLDYEGYLDILVYAKQNKTVAYRMLDIIEKSLFIKADQMVTELMVYAEYEANGIFLGIFTEDVSGKYKFVHTAPYVYQ